MPQWTVEDHLDIELADVHDVRMKLVAGEVAIRSGEGPARIALDVLKGPAVRVVNELETLRIHYDEWPFSGVRGLLEGLSSGEGLRFGRGEHGWDFGFGRAPEVAIALTVPSDTDLEITAISAGLVVSGVSGEARLSTVSGDVDLRDLSREVDVKTVSGSLYAKGLTGEVRAKSVSGDVHVVTASCTRIDAKTVSGEVDLELDLPAGGTYDVSTVSGGVGLVIPRHPSVTVEATTMSGRLETDFDLTWERSTGRKRLKHTLGGGQSRLSIRTLSGAVRLMKRREVA